MAVVLCKLDKLSLECHIYEIYAGIVAYADELIQTSPSLVCMQEMLDLCIKKLSATELKFNAEKYTATACGKTL